MIPRFDPERRIPHLFCDERCKCPACRGVACLDPVCKGVHCGLPVRAAPLETTNEVGDLVYCTGIQLPGHEAFATWYCGEHPTRVSFYVEPADDEDFAPRHRKFGLRRETVAAIMDAGIPLVSLRWADVKGTRRIIREYTIPIEDFLNHGFTYENTWIVLKSDRVAEIMEHMERPKSDPVTP